MTKDLRILVLEDHEPDADLINDQLRRRGLRFTSKRVVTKEEFLAEMESEPPDVILSDHALPSFDGFAALEVVRRNSLDLPFIFVTGTVDANTPIKAFQKGASGYVLKSEIEKLPLVVENAVRQR